MNEVKLLLERAASKLSAAKEDREDADYSITCEITEAEAELVIEDANAFLKRIEEAIKEIIMDENHENIETDDGRIGEENKCHHYLIR